MAAKKKSKRSLSELKTLGHQLLSSRAHINNLPILLTYISPSSPPHYVLESLLSLQSFFSPLLPDLPSSSSSNGGPGTDPDVIYRTWLRSKFDELVGCLIDIAVASQCEETLREVVLETIMEFVKVGNKGKFYSALYHKLIQAIFNSSLEVEFLLESLVSTYFKYIDVRFFTYITVDKLCKKLESSNSSGDNVETGVGDNARECFERSANKIYFILSHIPPLGAVDEKSEIESWSAGFISKEDGDNKKPTKSADEDKQKKEDKSQEYGFSLSSVCKKIKLKFTKAWMSFLRLPLPVELYKEVLVNLHQSVIPYLSNPVMLCDFLTRSYDIGGVISVMALNGLFVLMTKHGLEYPNFYEKLYALLKPTIFMAKHRAKFFQLLDSCLKSPLLPAYLAAAFTKKLSRLSLVVPPSGGLVIIALVHNLLRRHPSINCLVHKEIGERSNPNETRSEEEEPLNSDGSDGVPSDVGREQQGVDLFKDDESDPIKSNAMRSSLWEIDTLRHHYCPPVSRFVSSLENDLTIRAKTTEVAISDFCSGSYSTIFRDEMRRRVKQVPLAFYKATPTNLFSESDFPGWTFGSDQTSEALTVL